MPPLKATACPDLHDLDKKIRMLKDEIRRGYTNSAAKGYALRELETLVEDYHERCRYYSREKPAELGEYMNSIVPRIRFKPLKTSWSKWLRPNVQSRDAD
ncbi:hypothetical protein H009_17013, partial [Agrobacterium tumefaciens str. Cherry 2E-2-2]